MSVRTSELLTALVATVAVCLPCVAPEAATDAPGIRIVYHDLNLATPAGVAALYARIRAAAEHYCDPARPVTGTRLSTAFDRCVKDAVATTVQKVNQPGLSALHAARGGASGG
jgi:UrcA family protein